MIWEFRKYITENKLSGKQDRILLAVSGGIDSMVMATLFISSGADIGIAHCNFRLRGAESDKDEEFVRRFAARKKIPFHSVCFDTTGFASEKGISVQMAARELRYRWFEEIRSEYGYDSIAVAHNMNDNTETFLLNLTRGTGIAGLTGMKPRYNHLIRPLLFASRCAIEDYARRKRIAFREDSSNSDVKYSRNKIRHQIIPVFREINPSFDLTLTETAERLGEISSIVSSFISQVRETVIDHTQDLPTFKISELGKLRQLRTILFELFRPFGISSDQTDELIVLMGRKSGSRLFTPTHRILRNRNELIISPRDTEPDDFFIAETIDELTSCNAIVSARISKLRKGFRIPGSPETACLDAEKVKFPLVVRKWTHGDIFYPLGMNSRKKLSDHFIDRKYSLTQKERCLILESAGKIAWIIGDRIDNRFRVTDKTNKLMIIKSGAR